MKIKILEIVAFFAKGVPNRKLNSLVVNVGKL
jgi:hypothetical protein